MRWVQQWDDVLLLHYAADPEAIERHLPAGLEVGTFHGQAWISLVFFRLTLRPWGWPYVPGFSSLWELNVRTYVRCHDQPGITFLRMYADNRLAIGAARLLTPLDYRPAIMSANDSSKTHRRMGCQPRGTSSKLEVHFQARAEPQIAQPKSLDAWLVERYRLYATSRDGKLLAADVEHVPWRIAPVQIDSIEQSILGELPFSIAESAVGHYSPGVAATFKPFYRVPPSKQFKLNAKPRPARAVARCAGR
jgi:uncharacterized protein YqjF (DUF2071 family)